jgi:hypothetical protein
VHHHGQQIRVAGRRIQMVPVAQPEERRGHLPANTT